MTSSTQPQNDERDALSKPAGLSMIITFLTGGIIGAALFWIASDLWKMPSQTGISAMTMEKHQNMKVSITGQESGVHSHDMLAVDDWYVKPTIIAAIYKDPIGGWNLNLRTTNFTYNAAAAGLKNKEGEGHAHVYVNGVKLARIYGDWFHIGMLPKGNNIILVTLNANDHSSLTHNGRMLEHELMVMVQ